MPDPTLTPADMAHHYDAHYYRTYKGAPYERSAVWMAAFGAIADGLVREVRPRSVLDVGCAMGFLVEALRDRGVDASGVDISPYAISRVREDVAPHCWVGSAADPLPRKYDLIVCYEVLEHLAPADAEQAIAHMCAAADDIVFSSTPNDHGEETHVNVQPPEYWAAQFAGHGFIRDVDFHGASFLAPWAVRYRRSLEPLPRVVGDYERRMWTLTQENAALRTAVLTAKAAVAAQEAVRADDETTRALQRTVAEQREHLDALADRIRYMSDRETELRTLLHAAHEQLLQRDELLRRRGAADGDELRRIIEERTAWAERMVREAEERGAIIEEQQTAITGLHQVIEERTAWAERMVEEAEARLRIIETLQAAAAVQAPRGRLRRLLKR